MQVSFVKLEDRRLRIIVTGTGRSGTGFASRWLTSVGIPAGHEAFFDWRGLEHAVRLLALREPHFVGECSWEAAPFLNSDPLRDALVVHQVRHPRRVIESCLRVPVGVMPRYERFLFEHLPVVRRYKTELDRTACRWVHWNRMIEEAIQGREYYFWRVEDGTDGLLRWLDGHGLVDASQVKPAMQFANTHYNHKHGPPVEARLEDICPELGFALRDQIDRYGYLRWE